MGIAAEADDQPRRLAGGADQRPVGPPRWFDRLVFELSGPSQGYRVEYVSQVTQDGSGEPVPLRGGAFLQVVLASPAYDENGQSTYRPTIGNPLLTKLTGGGLRLSPAEWCSSTSPA